MACWQCGKKPNLGYLPDMTFKQAVIPDKNAEDFPQIKDTEDFFRTVTLLWSGYQ
jgi:hypothetical protein